MYHYILLFINKVLYYIRTPFLHIENPFCDFVIVIVWLGIKSLGGEAAFTYLSVKQIVTKAFAELVTPIPPKTIAFWIKLLTFVNREQKPHPTSPKGEEASLQVFCRNYLKKSQEPLSSYVRIGTPPPSGRLGGAPPPREGRSADREIAPKVSEVSARMLRDKRS